MQSDLYFAPFTSANQNKNRRETEQEYFMRLAREFEATRANQRREEIKQKIKGVFVAFFNLFKFKRTKSLEALIG